MLESTGFGRVLLDCGMHQGGDDIDRMKQEAFAFEATSIDAVILSHAHLDHSGLLPKLAHDGFDGPIFCTRATRDLLAILLRDSFGLYERDLERENRRRRRAGRHPLEPAYTAADVNRVLGQCECCEYHEDFTVGQGLVARFLDAGHILGSSIVELSVDGKKLVYSGDLGGIDAVLMRDPDIPADADVVLMESTYGDRNHRDMDRTISQLTDILHDTWAKGGSVVIPSFAVGRTQEILFHLGLLHHRGELDDWQVFLDSPMAIAVTELYDRWLSLLDEGDVADLRRGGKSSIRDFLPVLKLCESVDESIAINRIKSGAIIIAGSGMCTGGRVRDHIRHRIAHDRNTMIFIGFQASGTLGRLIVDGAKRIKLHRHNYEVKARIETLGGFSAHAGQRELISWVTSIGNVGEGGEVVLVHGEPPALQTLSRELAGRGIRTHVPAVGESITLD